MRFSIKQSFCGVAAGCAAIGSGQGFMICRGKICVYQNGLKLAFAIRFALAASTRAFIGAPVYRDIRDAAEMSLQSATFVWSEAVYVTIAQFVCPKGSV